MLRFITILLCCPHFLTAQWSAASGPAGAGSLFKVSFPSATTGYLAADNGDIFRTVNAGTSWSQIYNEGSVTGFDAYDFNDMLFLTEQTGFAVGVDFWAGDYLILKNDQRRRQLDTIHVRIRSVFRLV